MGTFEQILVRQLQQSCRLGCRFARRLRLCSSHRLQLPACCWVWGRHVDSISQPAPGLGQDVPAPIRASALRPEPIVSRSRGGSGRLLLGAPELPEPPGPLCLPAGLPTALPPRPASLGAPRPSPRAPGLARSSLLPTRARAAAAAGAAETITGGGSCGGAAAVIIVFLISSSSHWFLGELSYMIRRAATVIPGLMKPRPQLDRKQRPFLHGEGAAAPTSLF
ncbi:uncharacterized protein LOC131382325 [Hylobates moloch]|uniref:uncharacterized protein LOC131382325 n=1 Tax=Hylobates moloch TaxID=81572 RepID=UPI0026746199|nr:uncharacterized protein LOC131382325 [Hylobates moloch]